MHEASATGAPVKVRRFFNKIRDWTWIKHTIYSDYIVPWAAKVGFHNPVIYVIDGFAGRGSYDDHDTGQRIDGSPVIAALHARAYNQRKPNRKMRVICVENDPENHASLVRRVSGFDDVIDVRKGKFGDLSAQIAEEIGDAPALVFIDPIGLKAIGAEACRALLHRKGKTDVFVIVDFTIAHRAGGMLLPNAEPNPDLKGSAKQIANVDSFFDGSTGWRPIVLSSKPREVVERELIDLYFDEVLVVRFDYMCAYAARRNYAAPPRYWIVAAASHIDAFELMNNAIAKIDEQLYLRTYTENALPGIAEGMYARELDDRHRKVEQDVLRIVEEAGAAGIRFDALYEQLLMIHFGLVKHGCFNKTVKTLVRSEKLARTKQWWNAALGSDEIIKTPEPPAA